MRCINYKINAKCNFKLTCIFAHILILCKPHCILFVIKFLLSQHDAKREKVRRNECNTSLTDVKRVCFYCLSFTAYFLRTREDFLPQNLLMFTSKTFRFTRHNKFYAVENALEKIIKVCTCTMALHEVQVLLQQFTNTKCQAKEAEATSFVASFLTSGT